MANTGIIYVAHCNISKKSYIGKTLLSIDKRRKQHESSAINGSEYIFHKALRKYGIENFNWSVLLDNINCDMLDVKEREMVYSKDTKIPNGYNMTDGGGGIYGFKHSDKTKNKQSASAKKRFSNSDNLVKFIKRMNEPDVIKNKSTAMKKVLNTKEARNKKSDIQKNRLSIPENKKYLSDRWMGKNNPNYGKDMSGNNNPSFGIKKSSDFKKKHSEIMKEYYSNNPIDKKPRNEKITKNSMYECLVIKKLSYNETSELLNSNPKVIGKWNRIWKIKF